LTIMNLYVKLLLLGLLLVFFTTGSMYYFSNRAAKTTLKEQILEGFGQRASLKMASIDRFVQQRKSDIQTASLNPVLRSRTRFSTEELNALLHDLEEINSLYYSYSFFDTNRIRIADSKGLSVGERHSLSRYWEKIDFIHPKDNFIIDFSLSESIGKIVVHCACIVFDYRGKPTGVLVSRVLVDRLYDVFIDKDQIFEKYKARLELIDQNGNYLYSSEKEKWVFGQVFSGLPVNEILNGKSSAELEKEDRLFLLVKDRDYLNYKGKGWVIIYSLPTRSAFLPIHEIQDKLLLVLIGVVIIAILITFLATRLFTRPIEELTKTAKEMANGNLDASFIVRSHDEIQNLGLHLQKMARALKSKLQEQIELSDQLAQKNQSITDSIVFAQRIQNTILPPKPIWDRLFREHFIYYKPKDIVSGDFYYLTEQNNKILFAVADCTGHGVPGAFMSLLAYNFLVDLIEVQGLSDPDEIIRQIDESILSQFPNLEVDCLMGMEIGICIVDKAAKTVSYAGAGLDLFVLDGSDMKILKSKRRGLGNPLQIGKDKGKNEIFNYESGIQLVMSTDGYKDQMGGPNERKFMSRNFLSLLKENALLPLEVQKKKLEKKMEEWKGDARQIDDILVVGIRL